jgi:UDP-N-acetylmuramoyl-L-alanyl-D-glutamate--2,6-diaminopimelate ligase
MKLADILYGCQYEIAGTNESRLTGEGAIPSQGAGRLARVLDTDISTVVYDSRKVSEDGLFVAIKGGNSDGRNFIEDAIIKGAAAVICERPAAGIGPRERGRGHVGDLSIPTREGSPVFIEVLDSRKALACVSNNFYNRPSEDLSVIGVTGTNGKTTTTYLIKAILEAWGKSVGLIGTIKYVIGGRRYPALYTTPESPEFQGLLAEMVSAGCTHVVTEVSSHSLAQKRVDYTRFIVVVFTNLTRDHLDFHGTMESYYASKRRLFTELLSERGVALINVDDEWGRRLKSDIQRRRMEARLTGESPLLITYGITEDADIYASDIRDSISGIAFTLNYGGLSYRIDSPLVGMPNVYNLLAAASVGIALRIPADLIREGLGRADHIKGRLETVDAGQEFLCIIDYAHTPDALERLILTARRLSGKRDKTKDEGLSPGNRVIIVFGCGGDRDRGKRPIMGEIATRLSDRVIITSDNPRSEDPEQIIREITSGISKDNYLAVSDRRDAITMAVEAAGAGDVIVIAGKGHEDYQEIRGIRHKFSDREVAVEAIRKRLETLRIQDPRFST